VTPRRSHDTTVSPGHVPALVVVGLPVDSDVARAMLAAPNQFEPLSDGSFSAQLEVPPGTWRYWPESRTAFWLGRRADSRAPVRGGPRIDLFELFLGLGRGGLLLRDLKALHKGGWGPRLRAGAALRMLADDPSVKAVRGVLADRSGRAVRMEIHNTGEMAVEDRNVMWTLVEAVGAALDA
jgi:hypothetical protein